MYLELTTDVCTWIDESGKRRYFHFADIIDVVKIEEIRSKDYMGKYLCVQFQKENDEIKLKYDFTLNNIQKVKNFVAYHKRQRYEY